MFQVGRYLLTFSPRGGESRDKKKIGREVGMRDWNSQGRKMEAKKLEHALTVELSSNTNFLKMFRIYYRETLPFHPVIRDFYGLSLATVLILWLVRVVSKTLHGSQSMSSREEH